MDNTGRPRLTGRGFMCLSVVPLDVDGRDGPGDVPRLLEAPGIVTGSVGAAPQVRRGQGGAPRTGWGRAGPRGAWMGISAWGALPGCLGRAQGRGGGLGTVGTRPAGRLTVGLGRDGRGGRLCTWPKYSTGPVHAPLLHVGWWWGPLGDVPRSVLLALRR